MTIERKIKLSQLNKGDRARIAQVGGSEHPQEFIERLLEMGILEGSLIEVIHEAPFGRDPIAVRVRGSLVALRRQEADAVEVYAYE